MEVLFSQALMHVMPNLKRPGTQAPTQFGQTGPGCDITIMRVGQTGVLLVVGVGP